MLTARLRAAFAAAPADIFLHAMSHAAAHRDIEAIIVASAVRGARGKELRVTCRDEGEIVLAYNLRTYGNLPDEWLSPKLDRFSFLAPAYWSRVARLAERGLFDAIFTGDASAYHKPTPPVSDGLDCFVGWTAILDATEHVGVIVTASTTYNDPFRLAERLLSLDRLSGGRIAWNVVTSHSDAAARNFGHTTSLGPLDPLSTRHGVRRHRGRSVGTRGGKTRREREQRVVLRARPPAGAAVPAGPPTHHPRQHLGYRSRTHRPLRERSVRRRPHARRSPAELSQHQGGCRRVRPRREARPSTSPAYAW